MSHDSVTLSWQAPAGAAVTGYQILRRDPASQDAGVFDTVEADTGSADTSYADSTVQPLTRYVYRVKAHSSSGTSAVSNYVNVTIPDNNNGGDGDNVVFIDEEPLRTAQQSACDALPLLAVSWSITVTVGVQPPSGGSTTYGYISSPSLGGISDRRIRYATVNDVQINRLSYRDLDSHDGGELNLTVAAELPSDDSMFVDDVEYRFADAELTQSFVYRWEVGELGWADGDMIEVIFGRRSQVDDFSLNRYIEADVLPNGAWCEFTTAGRPRWIWVEVQAGTSYRIELYFKNRHGGWSNNENENRWSHPWIDYLHNPRRPPPAPPRLPLLHEPRPLLELRREDRRSCRGVRLRRQRRRLHSLRGSTRPHDRQLPRQRRRDRLPVCPRGPRRARLVPARPRRRGGPALLTDPPAGPPGGIAYALVVC